MKIQEIRKLSTTDLTKQITTLREEIASLRRQIVLGETQNSRAIRNKRRDLARMLTVLSEQLIKEAKKMAKILQGTVTSDRLDKTIAVPIVTHKSHPLYKKRYISSQKVMAHDEKNEAKIGDKVQISETRPLSARKRYELKKILERPTLTDKDVKGEA